MLRFTPISSLPLGPLDISTHALMMVVGIFTAYFLARRETKRGQPSLQVFDGLVNWAVIGGIIGARLLYVLLNPSYYYNILNILKIWQGGLVSFGGALGGFIGVFLYCKYKKVDWIPYADLLAPYVLLGWGIGRIGDFLAWEEFGTITTLPWGINTGFGVARHPVQLYTLLTMTIGFFLMRRLKQTLNAKISGYVFTASGIYYFLERFLMEFFRDDVHGAAEIVSYRFFAQGISIGLAVALLIWFLHRKKSMLIMNKMKNIIVASREMFKSWEYRLGFMSITLGFAILEIWLTSYSIILFVYRSDAFSWRDRISILWSAIAIFFGEFPLLSQILTLLTALLFGLNVIFLIYYLKKRLTLQNEAGVSILGMLLGLIGVGCASCGSVILSSVLGFAATTRLLTVLPLGGQEFSLLAIGLLCSSIYLIAQKIVNPTNCRITTE